MESLEPEAKAPATGTVARDTPLSDHVTNQPPPLDGTDVVNANTTDSAQKTTVVEGNGSASNVGVKTHDSINLNSLKTPEGVAEEGTPPSSGQWGSMFGRLRKRVSETASNMPQKPADSVDKKVPCLCVSH